MMTDMKYAENMAYDQVWNNYVIKEGKEKELYLSV